MKGDMYLKKGDLIEGVVREVSTRTVQTFEPGAEGCGLHTVLIDYGAKRNIVRSLLRRGCRVTVVPHDTSSSGSS